MPAVLAVGAVPAVVLTPAALTPATPKPDGAGSGASAAQAPQESANSTSRERELKERRRVFIAIGLAQLGAITQWWEDGGPCRA
jgi:hypothetical protein